MNNKKSHYDFQSSRINSEYKDKLPLEIGVSTLISVFSWRFLTILLAAIPIVMILTIAWLLSDLSQFISAIFLGLSSITLALFVVSLFRKEASSFDKFLKRLIDISISSVLLIFLSPLMVIIAILIKLENKGPVFFLQKRYGKNGKLFEMLKYRTMAISDDNEILDESIAHASNLKEDEIIQTRHAPKITRVGRILRKTSLNELPQLYNVLRGDMSLVGPRPIIPSELDVIGDEYFDLFKTTRPGITGLSQITFMHDTTYENLIRLDELYLENWSLLLDIKILLKTSFSIITTTGAY